MTQPQAVENVFGELRSGYQQLESYVTETFDRLMQLELDAASSAPEVDDAQWQQERATLTEQLEQSRKQIEELSNQSEQESGWQQQQATLQGDLDAARQQVEELNASLAKKQSEFDQQRSAWDQELAGLREMIEAKIAESPADEANDDAVLNSVLNQFANLK